MSQNPYPHDPFAAQPDAPQQPDVPQPDAPQPPVAPEQAAAPEQPVQPVEPVQSGAPQPPVEPAAQHPHDPYAYEPAPGAAAQPDPAAQPVQQPYTAQPQYAQQSPYGQQTPSPQGAQPQHPSHPGGPMNLDQPPAQLKGAYRGPLSGEPVSESDSKMWAMFAQLSAIVGYVIGMGMLGWLGPLIIFLVYKDRDRFVRYNAAEALNAAIATVIAEIALFIVISFIALITFGIGSFLYFLVGAPALVHVVFAILGAVKANQGEYWNYPVNIRLVK